PQPKSPSRKPKPKRPGRKLLAFDRRLGARFVAGTDEAGRGSLAGPLVVAGVLRDYESLRGHRVRPLRGRTLLLQALRPRRARALLLQALRRRRPQGLTAARARRRLRRLVRQRLRPGYQHLLRQHRPRIAAPSAVPRGRAPSSPLCRASSTASRG